jgi:hypothetical protein
MKQQRNKKARCRNCPHLWQGEERIPYGYNQAAVVTMLRCTKHDFDQTEEDFFCDKHPDFWEESSVGFKE